MLMVSQSKVDTPLLKNRTTARLNSTTQLHCLKNTSSTCYRNSVFHSLFSIDYFLNLLESGNSITNRTIPIYGQLLRAATHFRGGDERPFRGAVISAWSTMIRTKPTTGKEGRNQGLPDREFNPNDGGQQEDVGTLFDYLMSRLCETELNRDQRR